MPVSIISPRFSFVRFDGDVYTLPAYNVFDTAFQFIVNGDLPSSSLLRLAVLKLDGTIVPAFNTQVYATSLNNIFTITNVEFANFTDPFFLLEITSSGVTNVYNRYVTKEEFGMIMFEDFGFSPINSTTFLGNGFPLALNITTKQADQNFQEIITLGFVQGWGQGYVRAPGTAIAPHFKKGQCFRYAIINEGNEVLGQTNPFQVVKEDYLTSNLTYNNDENAFGFIYDPGKPNVIRLPLYLSKPQWPTKKEVYIKSTGKHLLLSASMEETYQMQTDYLNARAHKYISNMLSHDTVIISSSNIEEGTLQIINAEAYNVEWNEDDKIKTAPGSCTVTTANFGFYNSNFN